MNPAEQVWEGLYAIGILSKRIWNFFVAPKCPWCKNRVVEEFEMAFDDVGRILHTRCLSDETFIDTLIGIEHRRASDDRLIGIMRRYGASEQQILALSSHISIPPRVILG